MEPDIIEPGQYWRDFDGDVYIVVSVETFKGFRLVMFPSPNSNEDEFVSEKKIKKEYKFLGYEFNAF